MNRCPWCMCNDKMLRCHDEEWGVPLHDDQKLRICTLMQIFREKSVSVSIFFPSVIVTGSWTRSTAMITRQAQHISVEQDYASGYKIQEAIWQRWLYDARSGSAGSGDRRAGTVRDSNGED